MSLAVRILIVEDDINLRALWCDVLEDADHHCTSVDNARDAQDLLMHEHFDLVFLDLTLGPESGLSAATLADFRNPDCRVIVVTGSSLFPRGEIFEMSPSIVSILRKPVDIEDILAVRDHWAKKARIPGDAAFG